MADYALSLFRGDPMLHSPRELNHLDGDAMRKLLIALPLLIAAGPVWAQAPAAPPAAAAPSFQVPPELTDPAMAGKLANAMQALSKAMLDLPVGEVKAAIEGRKASRAEKRMTVRDLGRRDDPNFDRNLERQVAQAGPMIAKSMQAMAQALPSMMQGLEQASKAVERAAANMPDPTYPKR